MSPLAGTRTAVICFSFIERIGVRSRVAMTWKRKSKSLASIAMTKVEARISGETEYERGN